MKTVNVIRDWHHVGYIACANCERRKDEKPDALCQTVRRSAAEAGTDRHGKLNREVLFVIREPLTTSADIVIDYPLPKRYESGAYPPFCPLYVKEPGALQRLGQKMCRTFASSLLLRSKP